MKIQFEVHEKSKEISDEVRFFWMQQWERNFQKLIGQSADAKIFDQYDYFYVLRFDGQIGAIMSSARQNCHPNLRGDSYYSTWPEAIQYLKSAGVQDFHKMGMIAAEPKVIPRGFKMTRILIGCGMKFTASLGSSCQGVVSFPRRDTSVYQACVEWGAKTIKSDLTMYNVPVNFIVLLHSDLKESHQIESVDYQVRTLWSEWFESQMIKNVA